MARTSRTDLALFSGLSEPHSSDVKMFNLTEQIRMQWDMHPSLLSVSPNPKLVLDVGPWYSQSPLSEPFSAQGLPDVSMPPTALNEQDLPYSEFFPCVTASVFHTRALKYSALRVLYEDASLVHK